MPCFVLNGKGKFHLNIVHIKHGKGAAHSPVGAAEYRTYAASVIGVAFTSLGDDRKHLVALLSVGVPAANGDKVTAEAVGLNIPAVVFADKRSRKFGEALLCHRANLRFGGIAPRRNKTANDRISGHCALEILSGDEYLHTVLTADKAEGLVYPYHLSLEHIVSPAQDISLLCEHNVAAFRKPCGSLSEIRLRYFLSLYPAVKRLFGHGTLAALFKDVQYSCNAYLRYLCHNYLRL